LDQGAIPTRATSLQETLSNIIPICNTIGVTRLCDITYLDKLYIPNYCAVLPGTEDAFWVYSGKGPTKTHAIASALMESIERYCSLPHNSSKRIIQGTYSELSKSYNKVLHPDEVVEPVQSSYNEGSIIDFVKGFELISNQEILVPAQLVFSRYSARFPSTLAFPYSHTNGLASGNVLEEAICHALCEVIERDAASIADLCASAIPYTILQELMKMLTKMNYGVSSTETDFFDDASLFQEVDISEVHMFESAKILFDKFAKNGISLSIKDITQKDIGIPTFVASSVEWITNDYGFFALGYGTHVDSRIALIRAITELSQTRAINIQGSRDDLTKIHYKENDQIYKRKWQFMPTTQPRSRKGCKQTVMFTEIRSYIIDDLLDEIKFILSRLKKSGLKRVIIVNLTNPNVGIPVVRAIVPGLETFEVARLYTSSELLMGNRAKSRFHSLLSSNKR
jgi:ribosomal protein S12 methylthiotransferase accessory factor